MRDLGGRGVTLALGVLLAGLTVSAAAQPAAECTRATADRAMTPVSACTSCHADLGGGGRPNMFTMPGRDFGHPVDVAYDSVQAADPEHYVPRSALPADVPLAEGRITCLTCHDGRAGHEFSLARRSQPELCRACHKL